MFDISDCYVFIFSWKKVTPNALALYKRVAAHFSSTYFINCDEHTPITEIPADRVIQRDDSYYYGGQFETALAHTPVGKPMACIVGDVDPEADWARIAANATLCMNTRRIGIYAPNVDYTWHVARGRRLWAEYYEVPNTDCTCWFLHPALIERLRPLPYFRVSNLGWGIDTIFIEESRRQNLLVARDYSTLVRQPRGTAYNQAEARRQADHLMRLYAAAPHPSSAGASAAST
jgi:hypothetical protein